NVSGAPGIDGIGEEAEPRDSLARRFALARPARFVLLVLHPDSSDHRQQRTNASMALRATRQAALDHAVVVFPNNDPGSAGIVDCWDVTSSGASSRLNEKTT